MKKIIYTTIAFVSLFANSCTNTNGQTESAKLSPKDFSEKIKQTPDAVIIDVRTPEEFNGGHINNAVNIDWNGNSFDEQTNKIDKNKPLFVYCLKGGRSASAAAKLKENGFKTIYELDGGMLNWRSENMPETTAANSENPGMSTQQFEELLNTDKFVLVDFYAEWCGPCKQMKPFLEEISQEKSSTVQVQRIDVDKNKELAATMKVNGLPTIVIYKNKQIVWSNVGFVSKEVLLEKLK